MLLLSSIVAAPCPADDGLFWATPHVADTSVSWAVLRTVKGTEELNPFGFPGVVIAKAALEGVALGYRDAGDIETCKAVAGGALALLFGGGWAKSSWHRKQLDDELSQRRLASSKQQDAAIKAALKVKDDAAKQPPINTKDRSDFE